MQLKFFQKFIVLIIIFSSVFGYFQFISPNKAEALTSGEAVGKALGAGAACFLEFKLEDLAVGLVTKAPLIPTEDLSDMGDHPYAVPTTDVNLPSNIAKQQTSDALSKSKDCMRDVVAKILLDWVTDQTVQWIQGGGKPAYVTDWGKFGQDAFNAGVGEAINDSSLAAVCSPFKLQVKLSLLPVPRFDQQLSCTFDQIKLNVENFYKDFSQGGWLAYSDAWQPQNNYFGTMMMMSDEAQRKGLAKQLSQVNEAVAGKGFLSVTRCVEKQQVDTTQCYDVCNGQPDYNTCYETCRASLEDAAPCSKEEVVTPGTAVGDMVGTAITNDSTWAANIKSWVAALVDAVINRVTKEGLGYMTRSDSPSSGSTSGNFDPWYGYNRTSNLQAETLSQIMTNYQKLADALSQVRDQKAAALQSETDLKAVLLQLQTNCPSMVTASDLTTADSEITRLTTDKNNLDTIISDINNKINNIDSGAMTFDQAQSEYNSFVSANQQLFIDALDGNALKTAQAEADTKKSDLTAAQTKLNTCNSFRI